MQDVLAREAIRELVLRYCRAIDRRDFESLAQLYAENSVDDHGALFSGTGAEYVAWVPSILERMLVTSHQVFNHLIAVDGKYAEGEVYIQAYHLTRDSRGALVKIIGGGRYLDKYSCQNGQWLFQHRKIVADYELRLDAEETVDELMRGTNVGGFREADPSHGFFRLI
ncbi:MAG: nuclear transport factor 2 family protein [Gammaproteobacteria bacterium]|nr:nuclear transport factor 2 family protein [Gammaproteobacteria bacterium]